MDFWNTLKRFKSLFFLLVFWYGTILSQQAPVIHYSTKDLLPHNTVRSLLSSTDGALWIGTDNGLVKKLNTTAIYFFEEDGLPMNNIWALAEDNKRNIWMGSYGAGIAEYDGNNFFNISTKESLVHDEVTDLLALGNYLYVGTSNGISIVSIEDKKVVSNFTLNNNGFFRIQSFIADKESVFAVTYNTGIFEITHNSKGFDFQKINDLQPVYGGFLENGNLILGGKDKLLKIDPRANPLEQILLSKTPSILWNFITVDGATYASGWGIYEDNGGLFRISNDRKESTKISEIDNPHILSLSHSSCGNYLYVGSLDNGLYQLFLDPTVQFFPFGHNKMVAIDFFEGLPIRLFNDGLSLGERSFSASFFKKEQEKYVAKHKNKLPLHQDYFYEINYATPASKIIFYGIKTSDTHIWINTSIGLYKFKASGEFESYLPLHTLAFDFTADNKLIETNPYHGLRIYESEDPLKYTYYDENDRSTPTDVVGTLRNKQTTYFLSIFKGLFAYDSVFKSYEKENIWKEKKLRHATFFGEKMAISQEFGDVYIIETEPRFRIEKTIPRKAFRGNTITSLNSYQDWLIVTTELGVNFINGSEHILVDGEQGLDGPIYSSAINEDTLYLATDGGEFRVDLDRLLGAKKRLDSVFISTLYVNNRLKDANSLSELSSNQNNLKLKVETNAHPFPNKLSFQYKIKPDAEWQPMKMKDVSLNFLEPANYNVFIKVTDASTGEVMEKEVAAFTILSPIYARWWFILLSILVFLSLVGLYYNYKKKQQKARTQKEIAFNRQIEKLKTDALLAQMNPHFIFNALNSIQHLVVTKQNEEAADYLVKFAKLVRINLNNASRTFVTLKEELEYLCAYCDIENVRHGNRISIIFDIDPTIDLYEVQIPTMILQPFIENAFVHAFPPSIQYPELKISAKVLGEDKIEYSIRDNGIGSRKKQQKRGRESKGISLVKERLSFLGYEVGECVQVNIDEGGVVVQIVL